MSLHRCTEGDCPYNDGKPSPTSCACHKTDEQVLREQRDELLVALTSVVGIESNGGHGSHPFVRVYFDKPGDEQALHSLVSKLSPMGGYDK